MFLKTDIKNKNDFIITPFITRREAREIRQCKYIAPNHLVTLENAPWPDSIKLDIVYAYESAGFVSAEKQKLVEPFAIAFGGIWDGSYTPKLENVNWLMLRSFYVIEAYSSCITKDRDESYHLQKLHEKACSYYSNFQNWPHHRIVYKAPEIEEIPLLPDGYPSPSGGYLAYGYFSKSTESGGIIHIMKFGHPLCRCHDTYDDHFLHPVHEPDINKLCGKCHSIHNANCLRPKHPKWTEDELILVLELYYRLGPSSIHAEQPAIWKLCGLLNKLPIHGNEVRGQGPRSPDGVLHKLRSFSRLDTPHTGKDHTLTGTLEKAIWDEFGANSNLLIKTAESIVTGHKQLQRMPVQLDMTNDYYNLPEGKVLTKVHLMQERKRTLVNKKKTQALAKYGCLQCEVCGFDFTKQYGIIGRDFIECHHTMPITELSPTHDTKLKELALVCSNCHRMLHANRPWMSTDELRSHLSHQSQRS